MKKCPKCGTILDDAKKKCYMCGSDIQAKTRVDFMSGFDDQIGAAVTKSQDNVFNAVPDISVKVNEVVANKPSDSATFSSGASSADFFKNEMNSLNSMQYDERTAIEKIFSNDSRFRSKDEINAEEAMKKNNKKKNADVAFFSADVPSSGDKNNKKDNEKVVEENPFEAISNEKSVKKPDLFGQPNGQNSFDNVPIQGEVNQNVQVSQPVVQQPIVQQPIMEQPVMQQVVPQQPVVKEKKKKEKKVKQEKAPINWGNNLQKSSNNFSFINKLKSLNISPSFIFNTVCFILFATALIVMYFKFSDNSSKDDVLNIGDLNYDISSKFKLKNDDTFNKQYTYGDGCVVRIAFGSVTNSNDYLVKYEDDIKEDYSADEGYLTQSSKMTINGNTWSEISVIQLKDNPAATGGYSPSAKYRFVTIVYDNKYYELRYVNEDGDNTCSAMYDDLVSSLEFVD